MSELSELQSTALKKNTVIAALAASSAIALVMMAKGVRKVRLADQNVLDNRDIHSLEAPPETEIKLATITPSKQAASPEL